MAAPGLGGLGTKEGGVEVSEAMTNGKRGKCGFQIDGE